MIEIKSEFTGNGVETSINLSGDRFEVLLELGGTLMAVHKKLDEMQLDGGTENSSEEVTTCS